MTDSKDATRAKVKWTGRLQKLAFRFNKGPERSTPPQERLSEDPSPQNRHHDEHEGHSELHIVYPKGGRAASLEDRRQTSVSPIVLLENNIVPDGDLGAPTHGILPIQDGTKVYVAGDAENIRQKVDQRLIPIPIESSSLKSDPSAVRALGDEISTILDDTEIGLPVPKPHFPDSAYSTLLTIEKIESVLPEASPKLVEYINEKAKKIFAITVLVNPTELLPAMKSFYLHSVTDKECLPIEQKFTSLGECDSLDEDSDCGIECQLKVCGNCKHDARLNVFHHRIWGRTSIGAFYERQWSFFLQHFHHETFTYELHSHCILPFKKTIEKDSKIGPGHFSSVTQASMLAGSQDFIETNGRSTIKVAIKTLLPLEETGYNIVDEWTSEANAHKTLDRLGNAHITRGLAAYSQHEKYNIVLEWADGGSLRSFWKENPKPEMSKKSIMELLKQLYGLADALASMHNTSVSSSKSDKGSSASSTSGVQIKDFQHAASSQPKGPEIAIVDSKDENLAPEIRGPLPTIVMDGLAPSHTSLDNPIIRPLSRQSTRIGENWRHGDIKPENILRFLSIGTWLGILKLADLGRAKQRYLATRELPDKEIDCWRTKPYEAPDIWISKGEASMSRLYDCWGMGCVFFEAIVWMLYGQQAIWNFEETTSKAQKEGTPYWSRVGDSGAEVSALARGWMDHILEKDPECNRKAGTVMGDLMRLVKEKLFQIHLPPNSDVYMKGFRTNAEDMRQDLWAILNRAEAEESGLTDDQYIFTGSDRSTVHPPSIDQDFTAAQEPKPRSTFLPLPAGGSGSRRLSLSVRTTKLTGGRQGATTTRRHNQYTHTLNDVWTYVDDDEFAISVLQRNKFPFSNLFSVAESTICSSCAEIGHHFADFTFERVMRDLRNAVANKSCHLCSLLYTAAKKVNIASTETVSFSTSAAGLRMNNKKKSDFVLRFCRSWDVPDLMNSAAYPQIGLPRLPSAGSKQHINILRAWLEDCDERHECVRLQSGRYRPKRLLAVGSEEVLPRLVETAQLTEEEGKDIRYIALSHPWGDPTLHDHFRTTTATLPDYLDSVILDDLPQTFKDAVIITRDLNIKYIWIDSICIHQGDDGDFDEQAPFMQHIFGSAYCVLAASSADGMTSGFLVDSQAKAVAIPALFGITKDKLFVCQTVDDFQRDVLESSLNKRGWVFQERALAPRTIFFSKNQTYFECANGVRCETFSKLVNSEEAFLGDSDFPEYVKEAKNKGAQQYLFESLFKKYSRLKFSEQTDKPIAISGLEQRLLKVFEDRGGAGIFEKHWGRCLLWKKASQDESLKRIQFQPSLGNTHNSTSTKPKSRYKFRPPPSWSWMSYVGNIDYVQPPPGLVNWNTNGVKLHYTGDSKTAWFSAAENMLMEAEARDFCIRGATNANKTTLIYDHHEYEGRSKKKCVIIGSMTTAPTHYVLIVSPRDINEAGMYERIGVGWLAEEFIDGLGMKADVIKVE